VAAVTSYNTGVEGGRGGAGHPRKRRWRAGISPKGAVGGGVLHDSGVAVALRSVAVDRRPKRGVEELGVSSSMKKRGAGKMGRRRRPSPFKGVVAGRIWGGARGGVGEGPGAAWAMAADERGRRLCTECKTGEAGWLLSGPPTTIPSGGDLI
jgi:hypothetical protein